MSRFNYIFPFIFSCLHNFALFGQNVGDLELMFDEGIYDIMSSVVSLDDNYILLFNRENQHNPSANVAKGDAEFAILSKKNNKIIYKGWFPDFELDLYNFPKKPDYPECYGSTYACEAMEYIFGTRNIEDGYIRRVSDAFFNSFIKTKNNKNSYFDHLQKNNFILLEYNNSSQINYILLMYDDVEYINDVKYDFIGFDKSFNQKTIDRKLLQILEQIYNENGEYPETGLYITKDYCYYKNGVIYQLDIKNLEFKEIYKTSLDLDDVLKKRYGSTFNEEEFDTEIKFNLFDTDTFKFFNNKDSYLTDVDTLYFSTVWGEEKTENSEKYEISKKYINKDFFLIIEPYQKYNNSFLEHRVIHNYNQKSDTIDIQIHEILGISNNNRYIFDERSVYDLKNKEILSPMYYFSYNRLYPFFNNSYSKLMMPKNEFNFEILDLENDGQKIADYYYYSEDEWYIITPKGYFDYSDNNSKRLYYVLNNQEVFDLDQFYEEYRVKDLKEQILNGEYNESASSQKSLREEFMNYPPPKIKVELKGDKLHYTLTKRDTNHRVGEIELSIQEQSFPLPKKMQESIQEKLQHNLSYTGKVDLTIYKEHIDLTREKENSYVYLKAYNYNQVNVGTIHSQSAPLQYLPERTIGKRDSVKMYALFVGISDYQKQKLNYADDDAQQMYDVMKSLKPNFIKDVSQTFFLLKDSTATKDKIKEKMKYISENTKATDYVFLYFSGHGTTDKMIGNDNGKNFYFITSEVKGSDFKNPIHIQDASISTSDFESFMNYKEDRSQDFFTTNLKAGKKVLILDACHSQKIIDKDKSGNNERRLTLSQYKTLSDLNNRSGTYTLTAAQSDSKAYESDKYGHGLLTYGLLKKLKDLNFSRDGQWLDVNEWLTQSKQLVKETIHDTEKQQDPGLGIVQNTDFPILQLNKKVKIEIKDPKPGIYLECAIDWNANFDKEENIFESISTYSKDYTMKEKEDYPFYFSHDKLPYNGKNIRLKFLIKNYDEEKDMLFIQYRALKDKNKKVNLCDTSHEECYFKIDNYSKKDDVEINEIVGRHTINILKKLTEKL